MGICLQMAAFCQYLGQWTSKQESRIIHLPWWFQFQESSVTEAWCSCYSATQDPLIMVVLLSTLCSMFPQDYGLPAGGLWISFVASESITANKLKHSPLGLISTLTMTGTVNVARPFPFLAFASNHASTLASGSNTSIIKQTKWLTDALSWLISSRLWSINGLISPRSPTISSITFASDHRVSSHSVPSGFFSSMCANLAPPLYWSSKIALELCSREGP